jgi:uncharacterized protein YaaW (UPF0174 family)
MTVHHQISISPSQPLTRTRHHSLLPRLADQTLLQVLRSATGAPYGTPVILVGPAVWQLSCARGGMVASPSSSKGD